MPVPEKQSPNFNILDQHSDFNSGFEISKHDDFKNQYSTFIEQLEQTTQKLINEVFNAEYKPDVVDDWDTQKTLHPTQHKNSYKKQNNYFKGSFLNSRKKETHVEGTQSFQNFMTRNSKWCDKKNNNIKRQTKKKEEIQQKQLTLMPQILRGSRERLDPIYERAFQLHASKQKKRAFKRIEEQKKIQQQVNSYPFHPEINQKGKARTIQQYLQDKEEWERKRNQEREIRKLQQQAKKYSQCSFAPNLIAKPIEEKTLRNHPDQKVQERLLRSLEKAFSQV